MSEHSPFLLDEAEDNHSEDVNVWAQSSRHSHHGPSRRIAIGESGLEEAPVIGLSGWGLEMTPTDVSEAVGIIRHTLPILLLSLSGEMLTGHLLSMMTHWNAFKTLDELIILVPMMTNLKGNLEMNLAARLGTAANMGLLHDATVRNGLIRGNLMLLQVQALVMALMGSMMAFVLGRIHPEVHAQGSIASFGVIVGTGMLSTSLSSILLGTTMAALIFWALQRNINPDNVSTPVASTFGDLIALSSIGLVGSLLAMSLPSAICLWLVLALLFVALPLLVRAVRRNKHVCDILFAGWTPLLLAMIISSATGLSLDRFVKRFQGYATLAIVICAVPGAVTSVYCARLSTDLHLNQTAYERGFDVQPRHSSQNVVPAALLLISIPIASLFIIVVNLVGWLDLGLVFGLSYVVAFCIQTCLGITMAHHLTHILWTRGLDPDAYALPLLSSATDITGQLILVTVYILVSLSGGNIHISPSQT